MMKFFTNKKIWEKVILALIFVMLFQFAVMEPVQADAVEFVGKLTSPILSLFVTLGDGVMNILHSTIMGVSNPLLHAETDAPWWSVFKNVIAAVITAACVIGAIVLSGGIAAFLGTVALISAGSFYLTGESILVDIGENTKKAVVSMFSDEMLPEDLYLPAYSYSPEEIFKGNILLFNVDFFREPIAIHQKTHQEDGNTVVDYWYYIDEDGNEVKTSKQDSANILQTTVSTWYNALRNIAIVIMLSILVYIGIRILLATVSSEKAKYLNMLRDWFVGLCLLFLMHYIMAFSVTIVDKLTDVVKTSMEDSQYYEVVLKGTDALKESLEELKLAGEDAGNLSIEYDADKDGEDEYVWSTNLMGYLRTTLQMESAGGEYVGQALCFLVLVVFTVMFTFTYLRRLLYMAFLTLISPLVALTYCIDKLNDGSAQGFNKWFKEYIFNLLIQPMHLLLYFILVSSAFTTLGDNYIYSIVAIGFMLPAEKLLRSLFGFEKASTPSMLGGAAATSLMMSGIGKLTGMTGRGSKGGKGGDGSGSGSGCADGNSTPMRTRDVDSTNQMLGEENPHQDMQDTYDEKFGTSEWDAAESEAMNKEFGDPNEGAYKYSDEEYENTLRESGYSEEEIKKMMEEEKQAKDQKEEEEKKDEPQPRLIGKARRFAGRKGRAVGSAIKAGMKRKIKAVPRVMKGVAFGAAVGTAAIAGGTVAAVAQGDPGTAVTALTAGIGGGYLAGKSATNSKVSDNISPEVMQAYERMYNAPEYKEEMMEKRIKELKKDDTIRQKMKAADIDVKEMMKKEGHFEQFIRNGVDDIDDIIAAQKLIDKGTFNSVDHATAVIQNDKRMGRKDPNKMSKKTRNEWEDTFREEYRNAGASEAKANDTVNKTMNLVHELHKAKK